MPSKRKHNSIVFDYDGTLHDCIAIYAPAFRVAHGLLVERGLSEPGEWTDAEISRFLGLNPHDMWTSYNPALTAEQREWLIEVVAREMQRLQEAGHARLYEGIEEELARLVEAGYNLVFLSNCKEAYKELHRAHFGLDRFFSAYYTAEGVNNIPKHEAFSQFSGLFAGEWVVVGDRFHDLDIARVHGLAAVGCAYGYGSAEELAAANFVIDAPGQLADAIFALG